MQTTTSQSRLVGPGVTIAVLVFCAALYLFVPLEILRGWIREDGFFEMGSAVGWFLLAAACVYFSLTGRSRSLFAVSVVIASLLGLRELDFHKAFTTDSIFKTNYYLDVPAPLGEKLLGGAVALGIGLLLVYYVARYGSGLIRRLRRAEPPAVTFSLGLGLLVFSKFVDRSISVMQDDMHLQVAEWQLHLQAAFEEPLEFFLPLILLIAAYQFWRHQSQDVFFP